MRNELIFIAGLCFLLGLPNCRAQGLPQSKISITEFSSEDFPIRLSMDSLVELYGLPHNTYKNHKMYMTQLAGGCARMNLKNIIIQTILWHILSAKTRQN